MPSSSGAGRRLPSSQLSGIAVVPRVVIEEFEAGGASLSEADLAALRRALEDAGVIFIEFYIMSLTCPRAPAPLGCAGT